MITDFNLNMIAPGVIAQRVDSDNGRNNAMRNQWFRSPRAFYTRFYATKDSNTVRGRFATA